MKMKLCWNPTSRTSLSVCPKSASVSPGEPTLLRTALVLGLSAGLCESLARAVGYWLLFRLRRAGQGAHNPAGRWEEVVMVGLGHGGIEAMLLAVMMAATISSLW